MSKAAPRLQSATAPGKLSTAPSPEPYDLSYEPLKYHDLGEV